MSICPSIPEIQHFQNLTVEIQGQCQMTMMLHNYRSRLFHRTSNGIIPSSGFRDMGSAKCCLIWQVVGQWASPYGANGQITMTLHNYRSRHVHRTLNGGKSIQRFQRYAFRKVWTKYVANLKSFWPMGKPIWGKGVNDHDSAQLQA